MKKENQLPRTELDFTMSVNSIDSFLKVGVI